MHLIHRWIKKKDTGKRMYLECKVCSKRKVIEKFKEGHQPIDKRWLHKLVD